MTVIVFLLLFQSLALTSQNTEENKKYDFETYLEYINNLPLKNRILELDRLSKDENFKDYVKSYKGKELNTTISTCISELITFFNMIEEEQKNNSDQIELYPEKLYERLETINKLTNYTASTFLILGKNEVDSVVYTLSVPFTSGLISYVTAKKILNINKSNSLKISLFSSLFFSVFQYLRHNELCNTSIEIKKKEIMILITSFKISLSQLKERYEFELYKSDKNLWKKYEQNY